MYCIPDPHRKLFNFRALIPNSAAITLVAINLDERNTVSKYSAFGCIASLCARSKAFCSCSFFRVARKGLADTALKTADAGYLTRRLVDVSHDVIITEEDCGTLRGLVCTDLKNNDEVIATLYERILGRVSVHDIIHPTTGELLVAGGEEITEEVAKKIQDSPIESVEIRSVLTCEAKKGVCAKCYGRNLATSRMVQKGEAVGVIAAQSIGEPGTQLTLRTFHAGGTAANIAANASIVAKNNARLEFEELRTVDIVDEMGESAKVVVGRLAEVRFVDVNTGIVLSTHNVPYGSTLYVGDGDLVEKGKLTRSTL